MIFLSTELNSNLDLTIIEKKSYKILTFLSLEDKDLSILFVDDKRIKELNLQFRGIDKVTDVLSFSQNEGVLNLSNMLGDVVISLEQAKRQAPLSNNSYEQEVLYLIIHSVLHLIGYDHYNDIESKIMRAKEKLIFDSIEL